MAADVQAFSTIASTVDEHKADIKKQGQSVF